MKANLTTKFARFLQHRMCARREKGRTELFNNVLSTEDVFYLDNGNMRETLDVYSPDVGVYPLIIEVHGGGYTCCEKVINRLHAKSLALRGFHVINMDYTLQPEGTFGDELKEIFAVVEWAEKNADKYGFDLDKTYITGDSAGGHLVLLAGAVQGSERLQKYFGVEIPVTKLKAVAATCPAMDLTSTLNNGADKTKAKSEFDKLSASLKKMMFPDGKIDREYVNNVSIPVIAKECKFPPILIITTPTDGILYEEALRLDKILTEANVCHELKVYESKSNSLDHVFNVLYPEWEESVTANNDLAEFLRKY